MSDKEAIDRATKDYEKACNEGSAKALAAIHTDDAVVLAPGFPAVSGSKLASWFAEVFFDPFNMTLRLENNEVQVLGDWAFICGQYNLSMTPKKGGDNIEDQGKYLDVLQRQGDGSWKFARTMWNTNVTMS